MPVKSGIMILYESAASVSLGTLASLAAIDLSVAYQTTALTAGILLKKIDGAVVIEGLDKDGVASAALVAVLSYGNTSVVEVAAALVNETPDLEDDPLVDQATNRRIVAIVSPRLDSSHRDTATTVTRTLTFDLAEAKLPGKGLPFPEGIGWAWRIYNMGIVLTTGARAHIQARYMGVQLSD